ncbi:MAG TPA: capsule assembly Wzi family protein [Nitrospirota bacterium]|nr:capsule assembly Wzi family protein [Nitrospirota bacterium]
MGIRVVLFCLAVLTAGAASAGASTYLEVGDETYAILSRLEAEGVVRSGLLATKPLSRTEAARLFREAEKNSEGGSEFIRSLVRELKERAMPQEPEGDGLRPLDSVYGNYIHTNADVRTLTYGAARQNAQALNYNNDGDTYARGSNTRAGFTSRLEDLGRFSFFLNPEYRSSGSDHDLIIRAAYGVVDLGWDLVVGKESQWWGPGHHGALLLSNNAEPFTLARITNPEPLTLPWLFEFLGPVRISFFATELEKDRTDIPEPYLWGMRFDFKPLVNVEIGLQRTAFLGGRGTKDGISAWGKSFFASDAHDPGEAGDHRAGYDITLTFPFDSQPVQIYTEGAAEDSVNLPNQWAYLYGLYLPRLLDAERIELRVEWAETYDRHEPSTWYLHHVYTAGYTYKSRVIGHFMGTNSRDTFAELTYRVPERNARLSLFIDVLEHNISNPVREKNMSVGLRGVAALSRKMELGVVYALGRIENPGNERTETMETREIGGSLRYRF